MCEFFIIYRKDNVRMKYPINLGIDKPECAIDKFFIPSKTFACQYNGFESGI